MLTSNKEEWRSEGRKENGIQKRPPERKLSSRGRSADRRAECGEAIYKVSGEPRYREQDDMPIFGQVRP